MSADPELGLVYLPMGNATPDYWGGHRNEMLEKYASSIVALDVNTGQPRWHYQTVHHDVWDYDVPSAAILFDLKRDGQTIPAAERAFDVLRKAAAALCRKLPEAERPPIKLMSLHIWAISHGVASLFAQGNLQARKVPMTPEEILESAMLVYLKGLGILTGER